MKSNTKFPFLYFTFFAEFLSAQKRAIETQARNAVAEILKAVPSGEMVSEDALGYINYETVGGEFVETALHALRIDAKGNITVTSEFEYDENDSPVVTDWDDPQREMTFRENDHYSTINWTATLEMLAKHVHRYQESIFKKH